VIPPDPPSTYEVDKIGLAVIIPVHDQRRGRVSHQLDKLNRSYAAEVQFNAETGHTIVRKAEVAHAGDRYRHFH
jgi:hypothetical protein